MILGSINFPCNNNTRDSCRLLRLPCCGGSSKVPSQAILRERLQDRRFGSSGPYVLPTITTLFISLFYSNSNFFSVFSITPLQVKTQHLLGSSMFTRTSASEAKGIWQVRAWHVREFSDGRVGEWDNSSFVEFTYVKTEGGDWKLKGWRPHGGLAMIGKHDDVIGK